MTRTLIRLVLAGMVLLPVAAAELHAQGATPELTVITNTATASYSDANTNGYASVTASAAVTVGFVAGPNPTAASATATPAAGSTGNTMSFLITNNGNGSDNFVLAENGHAGVTVTGYTYAGVAYADIAAINTFMAQSANKLKQDSSATLVLTYSVSPTVGGVPIAVTITQTSVRTNTASGTATTTVTAPATRSVATTPDGATALVQPRAAVYTQTFTIKNTGNSSDSYNYAVSLSGAVAGAVTINLVGGSASLTGTVGPLASGTQTTVDVTYTVHDTSFAGAKVPAGTTASISLVATSVANSSVSNPGDLTVTVVRPSLTMTKVAYKDDQTTAIAASTVLPGQFIQYLVTVTNGSGPAVSDAHTVQVTDILPAQVTFQSATGDTATPTAWTFSGTTTVVASLGGTLVPGASRFFWIRVKIK